MPELLVKGIFSTSIFCDKLFVDKVLSLSEHPKVKKTAIIVIIKSWKCEKLNLFIRFEIKTIGDLLFYNTKVCIFLLSILIVIVKI